MQSSPTQKRSNQMAEELLPALPFYELAVEVLVQPTAAPIAAVPGADPNLPRKRRNVL
jgi:hypothetical protein